MKLIQTLFIGPADTVLVLKLQKDKQYIIGSLHIVCNSKKCIF